MLLESMSRELARIYLINNRITGAFIWKEDNHWTVFIGDCDNVSGFREKEFKLKRDAVDYCDKLNSLILDLLH